MGHDKKKQQSRALKKSTNPVQVKVVQVKAQSKLIINLNKPYLAVEGCVITHIIFINK